MGDLVCASADTYARSRAHPDGLARLRLIAVAVVTVLLVGLMPAPRAEANVFDTVPQSDLRNLVNAMDSYAGFDSPDGTYNGVTAAALSGWGWRRTSTDNVVIQITQGGRDFEAVAQDIRGSNEYSFMRVGPGTFNGVGPGTVRVSSPQPDLRPPTAGLTILYGPDRPSEFGPCRNGNECHAGDPVNIMTGNVYEHREDLVLPGRGLPFVFSRSYNSQDKQQGLTYEKAGCQGTTAGTCLNTRPTRYTRTAGPLGHGWTHNWETRLTISGTTATWTTPEGARQQYLRRADGTYAAPRGAVHTLTRNTDGTFTVAGPDEVAWDFDATGLALRQRDRNDNRIELAYTAGRLSTITDTVGRQIRLTYNSAGSLTTLTDPTGRTVVYTPSAGKTLLGVTDTLGQTRTYTYDTRQNLLTVTDPPAPGAPAGTIGHRVAFTYDAQDRATSSTGTGDADRITLAYGMRVTHVTDARGQRTSYTYDSDRRVTRTADPTRSATTSTWDVNGRRTSSTDALGNTTRWTYDAVGNITRVELPRADASETTGPVLTASFVPGTSRPTTTTTPDGTTTYSYDDTGNLTSVTDPRGHTSTATYDEHGLLLSSTDARGSAASTLNDGVTRHEYDERGNRVATVDRAGGQWSWTYDDADRPVTATDPNGNTTDTAYDARDRVTSITHPASTPDGDRASTTLTYDALGQLASITDENGHTSTVTADHRGNVTGLTSALQQSRTRTFDAAGLLSEEVATDGSRHRYVSDSRRLLTSYTLPAVPGQPDAVVGYDFDAAHRLAGSTDELGRDTTFDLDGRGQVSGVVDAADGITAVGYDWAGRVTRTTDPGGRSRTYTYDPVGNLLTSTDPLGGTTRYAYDDNSNRISRTDPDGRVTDYTYDAVDRLTGEEYDDGTVRAYAYDPAGNQVSASGPTGGITYTYDGRDRLTTETQPGHPTVSYTYDPAGNRTSRSQPDGPSTTYTYDDINRPTTVTSTGGSGPDGTTTFTVDRNDRLTAVGHPDGTTDTYAYDARGRTTSHRVLDSTTETVLQRQDYRYNAAGHLTAIDDETGETTYSYDTLYRLQTVQSPDGSLTEYAYDDSGNRIAATTTTAGGASTVTSSTYDDADRLVSTTAGTSTGTDPATTTYTHDESGRLVSISSADGTLTLEHDHDGRVLAVGDTTVERDPHGRIAATTTGATRTTRLLDGQHVAAETMATGPTAGTTSHYTRTHDGRLLNLQRDIANSGDEAPATEHYHLDRHGSVRSLSVAGALTDTATYGPFGETDDTVADQPYGYLSNRTSNPDSSTHELGLLDFHARGYDPATGRFTSPDPVPGIVEAPGTLNPYLHGVQNPLSHPDPDGNIAPAIVGGAVRTVACGIPGGLSSYQDAQAAYNKPDVNWLALGANILNNADVTCAIGGGLGGGVGAGAKTATQSVRQTGARACSFTGDTKVRLADGRLVSIADIEPGDEVLASDPEAAEQGGRPVLDVFRHQDDVYEISLNDVTLRTTADHPFWNATDRSWQRAARLDLGDQLLGADGTHHSVTGLTSTDESTTMYNLSVQDIHTYHVGDLEILVHNTCEPPYLVPGVIKKTEDRHFRGAPDQAPDKSYFDDDVDLIDLVDEARYVSSTIQPNGRCLRICDAGRDIGFDAVTGGRTSTYTVVSEHGGRVTTLHPGRPRSR